MIKILHFISDSNVGGAGRLLCNLIENIDNNVFSTYVALPKSSALIPYLSSLTCKIIELDSPPDTSFSVKGLIEAIDIIKKVQPDIVHSHASLSSRIASTLCAIPCRMITKHCAFPVSGIYSIAPVRYLSGLVNGLLSNSVIATADSAHHALLNAGYRKDSITTVLNGVPPLPILCESEKQMIRARYGLDKHHFIISIFARLEEYKGHKTLIEAAKICKKHFPSFRFFIVGDGSYENELKSYAKKLKVDDIICFTGFCRDVSPIFNITDVNVNCSLLSETSSLALCEGMSLGIPSVASDCSGNSYMVKNAVNGLLFPVGNADALAESLSRLYRDKALYEKCSVGAHKRYTEEFSAKIMAQKMTVLYKKQYRKAHKSTKSPSPLR